jgi:hypothetical protein
LPSATQEPLADLVGRSVSGWVVMLVVTPVPPGMGVVRRVAKVFGDRMVGLLFVLL